MTLPRHPVLLLASGYREEPSPKEKAVDLADALSFDLKWILPGDEQRKTGAPRTGIKIKRYDDFEIMAKSKSTGACLKLIQQRDFFSKKKPG